MPAMTLRDEEMLTTAGWAALATEMKASLAGIAGVQEVGSAVALQTNHDACSIHASPKTGSRAYGMERTYNRGDLRCGPFMPLIFMSGVLPS